MSSIRTADTPPILPQRPETSFLSRECSMCPRSLSQGLSGALIWRTRAAVPCHTSGNSSGNSSYSACVAFAPRTRHPTYRNVPKHRFYRVSAPYAQGLFWRTQRVWSRVFGVELRVELGETRTSRACVQPVFERQDERENLLTRELPHQLAQLAQLAHAVPVQPTYVCNQSFKETPAWPASCLTN